MIKRRNPDAKHYVNNEKFYYKLKQYLDKCDSIEAAWEQKFGNARDDLLERGIKKKKIFDHLPEIPWPRVTEYLGGVMFDIASRSNNMPNFCSYSYKDDMVADGYEDCVLRIKSFDTDRCLIKIYDVVPETRDKLIHTVGTREAMSTCLSDMGYKIDMDKFEESIYGKFVHTMSYGDIKIKINRNPFAYFTTTCCYASIRRIKKEQKQKLIKSEMIKNSGVISDMSSTTQNSDDSSYNNSYLGFLMDNIDQDKNDNSDKKKPRAKMSRSTKAHKRRVDEMENIHVEREDGREPVLLELNENYNQENDV